MRIFRVVFFYAGFFMENKETMVILDSAAGKQKKYSAYWIFY
ncbi:hypothetical protein D920_00345 [Enterococcus faecalis 13-SD-W-01]|jgi:hypothetical protein|nr:hypothetical protein D920_00345 [Enterococcus faecalis 13-SD-W-01]